MCAYFSQTWCMRNSLHVSSFEHTTSWVLSLVMFKIRRLAPYESSSQGKVWLLVFVLGPWLLFSQSRFSLYLLPLRFSVQHFRHIFSSEKKTLVAGYFFFVTQFIVWIISNEKIQQLELSFISFKPRRWNSSFGLFKLSLYISLIPALIKILFGHAHGLSLNLS